MNSGGRNECVQNVNRGIEIAKLYIEHAAMKEEGEVPEEHTVERAMMFRAYQKNFVNYCIEGMIAVQ